ncbi:hypothetical protein RintRC_4893 [Richelia intracellularis]|nr:hypothetical protein RintRC_4893 [Richelia intracellularis]
MSKLINLSLRFPRKISMGSVPDIATITGLLLLGRKNL